MANHQRRSSTTTCNYAFRWNKHQRNKEGKQHLGVAIGSGGTLSDPTKRAVEQAKERGASNWLSTLPLEDQGFTLNKGEFRDALAIRYNKD